MWGTSYDKTHRNTFSGIPFSRWPTGKKERIMFHIITILLSLYIFDLTLTDWAEEGGGLSDSGSLCSVLAMESQRGVEGGGRVGTAHHLPQLLQAGQGQLGVSLFYVNL